MNSYQIFTLVLSYFVVAFLVWLGCRYIYETRLIASQRKLAAVQAEGMWTIGQLREVRDQFRALEAQLIFIQLEMEQTHNFLEEKERFG